MRADALGNRLDARRRAKIDRQPPVLRSVGESSFSQRGVHPRGSRRSDTTMSAAAQARVKVVHSIQVAERVASSRHSPDGLRSRATQASCEQAL
jgi:hypothetical protein